LKPKHASKDDSNLGVPSKMMGLEPMCYDARVLTKDAKVIKVRSTWLMSFKVIKDF
jgi:hypothetical protein